MKVKNRARSALSLLAVGLLASSCTHETGLGINVEGGLGNQTMMTRADTTSDMEALVEGQLGWTDENCLGLALDGSMTVTPAVFPYGTVFLPEWDGILLRDGTTLMVGDQVSLAGGFLTPPDDIMRHVPLNCHVDGDIPFMND